MALEQQCTGVYHAAAPLPMNPLSQYAVVTRSLLQYAPFCQSSRCSAVVLAPCSSQFFSSIRFFLALLLLCCPSNCLLSSPRCSHTHLACSVLLILSLSLLFCSAITPVAYSVNADPFTSSPVWLSFRSSQLLLFWENPPQWMVGGLYNSAL